MPPFENLTSQSTPKAPPKAPPKATTKAPPKTTPKVPPKHKTKGSFKGSSKGSFCNQLTKLLGLALTSASLVTGLALAQATPAKATGSAPVLSAEKVNSSQQQDAAPKVLQELRQLLSNQQPANPFAKQASTQSSAQVNKEAKNKEASKKLGKLSGLNSQRVSPEQAWSQVVALLKAKLPTLKVDPATQNALNGAEKLSEELSEKLSKKLSEKFSAEFSEIFSGFERSQALTKAVNSLSATQRAKLTAALATYEHELVVQAQQWQQTLTQLSPHLRNEVTLDPLAQQYYLQLLSLYLSEHKAIEEFLREEMRYLETKADKIPNQLNLVRLWADQANNIAELTYLVGQEQTLRFLQQLSWFAQGDLLNGLLGTQAQVDATSTQAQVSSQVVTDKQASFSVTDFARRLNSFSRRDLDHYMRKPPDLTHASANVSDLSFLTHANISNSSIELRIRRISQYANKVPRLSKFLSLQTNSEAKTAVGSQTQLSPIDAVIWFRHQIGFVSVFGHGSLVRRAIAQAQGKLEQLLTDGEEGWKQSQQRHGAVMQSSTGLPVHPTYDQAVLASALVVFLATKAPEILLAYPNLVADQSLTSGSRGEDLYFLLQRGRELAQKISVLEELKQALAAVRQ